MCIYLQAAVQAVFVDLEALLTCVIVGSNM